MSNEAQELIRFLKSSPTCFQAVETIVQTLEGFEELKECAHWQLKPGGRYYVTRNRSSVIAFTMPEDAVTAYQITACHDDSPTFKLKENAELEVSGKYIRLDTERYGGMIMSTWFDRPLSIAGRAMVRTSSGVSTRLIHLDYDACIIPNLAIHMNRSVNDGYKFNPAVDTFPLWSTGSGKGSLRRTIAEAAGVQEEDLLSTDLFLYNRTPGTVWGQDGEFISAGRLDDMECVYAAVRALLKAGMPSGHVNVAAVFDNEEVGSSTKQGAQSTFLNEVLHRISACLGMTEEEHSRMLTCSFMLSADNAHAVHPNHPEISDPLNKPYMNEGIVIKFNANQKYTSDAVSAAIFRNICEKAGVPVQFFCNRSDMAGGSTLGNISTSQISINSVDIGLAQLAMHSSYETAGTRDLDYMIDGMTAFYQTKIGILSDGEYTLD